MQVARAAEMLMPDFGELFSLTVDPLELVVRGTVVYVGLVLVFRFALQRDLVGLSVADVLFIALIADAAQNGMAGEYRSITDAIVLLGTLAFWNAAMNFCAFRWKAVRRLLEPPTLELVRDGRLIRRNLKREWISVEELMSQLRAKGIEDMAKVKLAILEADGELSVLEKGGDRRSTDPASDPVSRETAKRG
jgi:uncharacterized membrane protein YcaP (DUF421 family)